MNNIEKIYRLCDKIEKEEKYLFCLWPIVDGRVGLDVLDYETEDKVDGSTFDNALDVIDWLEENYVR
uniref:Phage protein n=1 Tax=Salmonella phage vB_SenS_Jbel TaxID=3236639 RepID=A0AB39AK76_9CAUD